jgi:hypothetical protein
LDLLGEMGGGTGRQNLGEGGGERIGGKSGSRNKKVPILYLTKLTVKSIITIILYYECACTVVGEGGRGRQA